MSEYDDLMAEVAALEVAANPKAALRKKAEVLHTKVWEEIHPLREKVQRLERAASELDAFIKSARLGAGSPPFC